MAAKKLRTIQDSHHIGTVTREEVSRVWREIALAKAAKDSRMGVARSASGSNGAGHKKR